MMPISDLAQEFLKLEELISLELDIEKAKDLLDRKLAILERIKELRPLQDPSIVIGRYRT